MSKLLISQVENHKGNFGEALRSSAVFYFIQNETFTTTISFLNYWFVRRELEVTVLISLRDLDGNLIHRQKALFNDGMVYNYIPDTDLTEGSIEVEVFSIENLVIPYAAVMAVYQSEESVSMVHSYSRTYSPHEIEEKRTITKGRESCWTIKDDLNVSSFCIMHNGSVNKAAQKCELNILTNQSVKHTFKIEIPELRPFSTYRLNLKDHVPELIVLLNGDSANASLSFELENSFTRLLVGNYNKNTSELQVTHSNFNYQEHATDNVDAENPSAYMSLINLPEHNLKVIIYPDMAEGNYSVQNGSEHITFSNDIRSEYSPKESLQVFKTESGRLPSRIVTAFSAGLPKKLPFECSLGVIHEKRPPKRMWWGLVGNENRLKSRLFLTINDNIYGKVADQPIFIRLYSAKSNDYIEAKCSISQIIANNGYIYISDLFDSVSDFLANEFGYFTLYSEYGGYFVYSSLENETGSITIEHGF